MAADDYKVSRDGVEMNISKAIRHDKVKIGWSKLYKLKERFYFNIISNNNNIVLIECNGIKLHFALVKWSVRREGSNKWSTKVVEELNNILPTKPVKKSKSNLNRFKEDIIPLLEKKYKVEQYHVTKKGPTMFKIIIGDNKPSYDYYPIGAKMMKTGAPPKWMNLTIDELVEKFIKD